MLQVEILGIVRVGINLKEVNTNTEDGFTLLEIMVVVVIIGILVTLGLGQYSAVVKKSRDAEARQVIGQLRKQCAAMYMGYKSTANCTASNLCLSTSSTLEKGQIPGTLCWPTHYFRYGISVAGAGSTITFRATRCVEADGGKNPWGDSAYTLELVVDYATGGDTWSAVIW